MWVGRASPLVVCVVVCPGGVRGGVRVPVRAAGGIRVGGGMRGGSQASYSAVSVEAWGWDGSGEHRRRRRVVHASWLVLLREAGVVLDAPEP